MLLTLRVCFQGPDEMRKVSVPAHRYTPLKENWLKIFTPIVENLQLQVRFNLKTRNVEIKVCRGLVDSEPLKSVKAECNVSSSSSSF